MTQASHADIDLAAALADAETRSILARERQRDAERQAALPPPLPAPTPKKPPATAAAPARRPQARPQTPTGPVTPALPPGSVVLSAAEMAAVDRLIASHPETRHLSRRTP